MKEIDDAIELFESAHYRVLTYDAETGGTNYSKSSPPNFRSVRKLKARRKDYRPGRVKVYTTEEIDDYVKSRSIP